MTNSDQTSAATEREYSFDAFRLIPTQQLLLYQGMPVRLGSRALDILAELVERPGELVGKRELMARAWPSVVVEESNLKVHIAALRRALGEGGRESRYVATVSGRGYRFVAPVSTTVRQVSSEPDPATWEQMRKLPVPATRTTGRSETIAALLHIMQQRRFVSIVGPGGIGKSTVALPVAEAFIAQAGMEICFVELSSLSDPKFLVSTVATALGLTIHSGDGLQALVATLRERRLLLVLDSCEHVIDGVAVLVDRVMNLTPEVRVLATSREPLRAAGEYVYRLTPLGYPAPSAPLTAAEALKFPAVMLFVLRACECLDGYELSDADAPAVVEICRRLEGIPLAIELAATRMDALGASGLATRLGDRFELLKRGRRGVLERHRTLAASLDWSYDLLPEEERALLRKLAIFSGSFDLDAASGLCQDAPADAALIVDGVANLVDKSLLVANVSKRCVHYRLLDTTKAYALEKLDQCGETDALRRRHLAFHQALLLRAAGQLDTLSDADWLASYQGCLDDVRSALAWAFASGDRSALAVSLTVSAIPLWTQLSLLDECYQYAERALAAGPAGAQDEMELRAALAAAALYVNGPVAATEAAWAPVLVLADRLQNPEYQRIALWGMAVCRSYAGALQGVQDLAERCQRIVPQPGSRSAPSGMDRMVATAQHYAGEHAAARKGLERILDNYSAPATKSRLTRMQLNQRSASLAALANVLWVQGYPDQSVTTVWAAMQAARDSGHAPSAMYAIANAAFPIMIQIGDHDAADALLAELADFLKKHAFSLWDTLWKCLHATLQVQRGVTAALVDLERAVAQLQESGYRPLLACHLAQLAMLRDVQGQRDAALVLVEHALSLCASGQQLWCHAEILRIKGALLEPVDEAASESLYYQAIRIAESQRALSWQLRATNNLARLKMRQGAGHDGRRQLHEIYQQFSEGYDTADLREARSLLERDA